ncbi:hypothetical protein [Pseudomonas plecoglossicida]|uniref:hypothetical protein n=1 Tax=Pseudomonas plecoglossicida TaxID=70775 RepID=UPI00051CE89D|nr:hypothetical protein [Pseudomonas plecoglossicida]KGK25542.1 hypothetical protein GT93_12145 [Pseudomonas plecoglossicida]
MSKPEWKYAPEWAEWIAADGADGYWVWYESEPSWMSGGWWYSYTGEWLMDKRFPTFGADSEYSLERRP